MSFCHKLWFSNTYISSTQFCTRYIFQTMNSVRSNSLSLKYQGFSPSGCQDIITRKFEFVSKTQFLWLIYLRFGWNNVTPWIFMSSTVVKVFITISSIYTQLQIQVKLVTIKIANTPLHFSRIHPSMSPFLFFLPNNTNYEILNPESTWIIMIGPPFL